MAYNSTLVYTLLHAIAHSVQGIRGHASPILRKSRLSWGGIDACTVPMHQGAGMQMVRMCLPSLCSRSILWVCDGRKRGEVVLDPSSPVGVILPPCDTHWVCVLKSMEACVYTSLRIWQRWFWGMCRGQQPAAQMPLSIRLYLITKGLGGKRLCMFG